MRHLDTCKTALAVGIFLGGWHLIWSLLIAFGVAQALFDLVLWMHMIHMQVVIGPMDVGAAAALVVFTTLVGWFVGYIFALLWNWLYAESESSAPGHV